MGLPQFAYPITFLPCRDLEAVRQFYETILLLPVALEQSRCLLFKIGHDPHYAYWGFCEQEAEQGQKKEQNQEILSPPKKVCLTLVVSTRAEVDRWHHELHHQNILCTKEPAYTAEYHIYNVFYTDPTGYTVEIQAFDDDGKPAGG